MNDLVSCVLVLENNFSIFPNRGRGWLSSFFYSKLPTFLCMLLTLSLDPARTLGVNI